MFFKGLGLKSLPFMAGNFFVYTMSTAWFSFHLIKTFALPAHC